MKLYYPKVFKRLDTYLVTKYPTIWATSVHFLLYFSAICINGLYLFVWLFVKITRLSYAVSIYTTQTITLLLALVGILASCVFLINQSKHWLRPSIINVLLILFLNIICLISILSNVVAPSWIIRQMGLNALKKANITSEEVVRDYVKLINEANLLTKVYYSTYATSYESIIPDPYEYHTEKTSIAITNFLFNDTLEQSKLVKVQNEGEFLALVRLYLNSENLISDGENKFWGIQNQIAKIYFERFFSSSDSLVTFKDFKANFSMVMDYENELRIKLLSTLNSEKFSNHYKNKVYQELQQWKINIAKFLENYAQQLEIFGRIAKEYPYERYRWSIEPNWSKLDTLKVERDKTNILRTPLRNQQFKEYLIRYLNSLVEAFREKNKKKVSRFFYLDILCFEENLQMIIRKYQKVDPGIESYYDLEGLLKDIILASEAGHSVHFGLHSGFFFQKIDYLFEQLIIGGIGKSDLKNRFGIGLSLNHIELYSNVLERSFKYLRVHNHAFLYIELIIIIGIVLICYIISNFNKRAVAFPIIGNIVFFGAVSLYLTQDIKENALDSISVSFSSLYANSFWYVPLVILLVIMFIFISTKRKQSYPQWINSFVLLLTVFCIFSMVLHSFTALSDPGVLLTYSNDAPPSVTMFPLSTFNHVLPLKLYLGVDQFMLQELLDGGSRYIFRERYMYKIPLYLFDIVFKDLNFKPSIFIFGITYYCIETLILCILSFCLLNRSKLLPKPGKFTLRLRHEDY